jgi:hypothetical protein
VASDSELTAAQAKLVKDTAVALAKELADLPRRSSPSPPIAKANDPPRKVFVPKMIAPVPRVTRPEETLLAVAGLKATGAAPVEAVDSADGDSLGQGVAKGTKKRAGNCFRCNLPGHCLNDCTTVLCACCWKADHKTIECPLILAPKPNMIVHGVAHEELMFWEFPMTGMVRPRLENTRLGRVTISNGSMSIPQIITRLQWIVPDDSYQWDVRQVENDVFMVNFPSKLDLVRTQHFGCYTDLETKISMSFDF